MLGELHSPFFCIVLVVVLAGGFTSLGGQEPLKDVKAALETELVAKYGESQRPRLRRGLEQAARFWRQSDGDAAKFQEMVRAHFAGDQSTIDVVFERFERLLEQLDGHMNEIVLAFKRQTDLDLGAILPMDEIFSGYDPAAHISEDFFENRLAFCAILNFPFSGLEERLRDGDRWTRRQWADTKLAERFSKRIPAEVKLAIAEASAAADKYIYEYNIWMHHLLDGQGRRLFPPKLRLISHWNLRDEIKANYDLPDRQVGLEKQRLIQLVMERIVRQTIPAIVVNDPFVDWNPASNEVTAATAFDSDLPPPPQREITNDPEPDTRYAVLLKAFQALRKADPYSPTAPTHIARRFNEERQIPEDRVRGMFEQVLSSPLVPQVAKRIEARLGRPLEPFDIWYSGFRPRRAQSEAELDALVGKKYPTPDAYRQDMPNLLKRLGFSEERARYLADNIVVDPSRGPGHAWGPAMRGAKAHLRTRVGKGGMNYKGFNIAMHEMGHTVEQIFSLHFADHTLLGGVPNTAFTEAIAFVFQQRDLEVLGLAKPDPQAAALQAINDFWATCEIASVALVDMAVWHWMYEHPEATPAELKEATLEASTEIWNKYYAPVIGKKDVVLLGIYSHMINSLLYLPDYPLGHLIAHQIEDHLKKTGNFGAEIERMMKSGTVAPDLWMRRATGSPVGPEALLAAAKRALQELPE